MSVQVEDSDRDASNTRSITVTISNVAPTVTIAGAEDVVEGSTHTYTFTVTDPGVDSFSVDAGYPNCGLEGDLVAGSLVVTASGGSFDCSFPDGDAETTLIIKVTDDDGDSDVQSTDVHVVEIANVAPVVTLVGAQHVER